MLLYKDPCGDAVRCKLRDFSLEGIWKARKKILASKTTVTCWTCGKPAQSCLELTPIAAPLFFY